MAGQKKGLLICLILGCLPLLSILGSQLVNSFNNNILLLALIVMIALMIIVTMFFDFIPTYIYPLLLLAIALSLVYHYSLITPYIVGADIHSEYYFANRVLISNHWDQSIDAAYNGMLSIVMLAPMLSQITGLDLTWVFKVIYPLVFALVPVILYKSYQKQIGQKSAFLASFFFASFFVFYGEALGIAKMQIGELFVALILLLIVNKNVRSLSGKILATLFVIALVTSYYSLSSMFLILFMTSAWIMAKGRKIIDRFLNVGSAKQLLFLTGPFLILSWIATVTWYVFVSGGSIFTRLVLLWPDISVSINELSTRAVYGGYYLQRYISPLHEVATYLNVLTIIFMTAGFFLVLIRCSRTSFSNEYLYLAASSFGVLAITLIVPSFAYTLNTNRIYQISLLLLSPFCVIGGVTVFRYASKLVVKTLQLGGKVWHAPRFLTSLRVLSIVFILLLLFQTGFMYEIAKDKPNSIPLSEASIRTQGSPGQKASFYATYTMKQDVFGVSWIARELETNLNIYTFFNDFRGARVLVSYGGLYEDQMSISNETKQVPPDSIVFLQYLNVVEKLGTEWLFSTTFVYNITENEPLFENMNVVYSNGGSKVLSVSG